MTVESDLCEVRGVIFEMYYLKLESLRLGLPFYVNRVSKTRV